MDVKEMVNLRDLADIKKYNFKTFFMKRKIGPDRGRNIRRPDRGSDNNQIV